MSETIQLELFIRTPAGERVPHIVTAETTSITGLVITPLLAWGVDTGTVDESLDCYQILHVSTGLTMPTTVFDEDAGDDVFITAQDVLHTIIDTAIELSAPLDWTEFSAGAVPQTVHAAWNAALVSTWRALDRDRRAWIAALAPYDLNADCGSDD